jgi:hypothetical protein
MAADNSERHPLDDDLEDTNNDDSEELAPCITTALAVVSSADVDERARLVRETQLAMLAEIAWAELVEDGTDHATTSRLYSMKFIWMPAVLIGLVGVGTIGGLVFGHSSRDSPNNLGRLDSNVTAPTTAMTENPSASPTAWTPPDRNFGLPWIDISRGKQVEALLHISRKMSCGADFPLVLRLCLESLTLLACLIPIVSKLWSGIASHQGSLHLMMIIAAGICPMPLQ